MTPRASSRGRELLESSGDVVQAGSSEIEKLRQLATDAPLGRARLCAHLDTSDALHEMLIVLDRATYVRPHRHPGKTESFHVIEGVADVVLFDQQGAITEALRLGEYGSDHPFYYRLNAPRFHTVLVRSDVLVVHETTNGPFDPSATLFAPWAPGPEAVEARAEYLARLDERLAELRDPP